MPTERKSESSDIAVIGQTLWRRKWVIVACFVVALGASLALTLHAEKEYAATSSLLLRPSSDFEPQRTVETNMQLLSLPVLAKRTAEKVPGTTTDELKKDVEISQQGESDIVRVKATANDPDLAAEIANTYADEFIAFRGGSSGEGTLSSVRIVERAIPENSPVSPKPVKNAVFGGLIGLVLGIGIALLLEQLDSRVKREEDLPEVTNLAILATIPRRKEFAEAGLGAGALTPAEAEIFLRLRANLRYFNARKDIRSLLVTSAAPEEGKTMVTIGLSLAAAMTGERTLLVDADLRDPSISRVLGIPRDVGLSSVLASETLRLSDAVVSVPAARLAESAGTASFDVLSSGPIPSNPTQLLASRRMRSLIGEAEAAYDLVVFDSPPILLVADTIPLVSLVSGVLAVSGLGVGTRSAAAELAEHLEMMEAPTLGLVANFAASPGRSMDGYGYGRPPEIGPNAPSAGQGAGFTGQAVPPQQPE